MITGIQVYPGANGGETVYYDNGDKTVEFVKDIYRDMGYRVEESTDKKYKRLFFFAIPTKGEIMGEHVEVAGCEGEYVDETSEAYLLKVATTDGEAEVWIPKSLINILEIENDIYYFETPEWFAIKKGLI